MPKTIAFVNGKGGVGKTTVSTLVAAVLKETGVSVSIEDKDPQRGATSDAVSFGIPLGTSGDYIIIDTAPNLENPSTIEAIKTADFLVLVTTPASKDLDTTLETARIIKNIRKEGRTVVIFNKVPSRTKSVQRMPEVKKLLPFPAIDVVLPRRQAYEDLGILGWKSLEKEAKEETVGIVAGILDVVLQY